MKTKKHIHLLATAALLALAACTQDETAIPTGETLAACTQDETAIPTGETHATLPYGEYPLQIGGVTFDAESSAEPWSAEGPQTRVTEDNTDGKSSVWQWDGSEMIGVRLGNETATYTLNAGKALTSDNQLYWTSTAPATVAAWYPTYETVDLSDQSNGLVYVLKATAENATYNNEITLGFKHQLAKVRVVLSGTQASLAQSVEVYGYTTCTNNEGVPTAGSTQGWLKMKKQTYGNTECWEANVVPGDITLDNFVRINGQTATVNDGFPTTLEAARMYTIDLTVGENQIFGGETITKPGEYIVKGTVTESITLDSEGVTLILEEADINTNGIAINIVSGNPTLKIQGTENAVKSATSTAIHVGNGCTLTIEGVNGMADKLKAEGGKNDGTATTGAGNAGAGIGSSNGGNIVISNVTIEAEGNTYSHFTGPQFGGSAAIGSSVPGYCGDITIDNATVTATGGYWAAAIGMSGCLYDSYYPDLKIGKIHISRSVVTATGGEKASAIGLACMEDPSLSSAYADEIYIETDETSATFLGRLTSSGNFKIGKGNYYSGRMTFYNQDGSGTWPGVTLKASDGTQTSPDGIGQ